MIDPTPTWYLPLAKSRFSLADRQEIEVGRLDVEGNLLALLLRLGADHVIRAEAFLHSVGRSEAVENRDTQAHLHLPAGLQRKRVKSKSVSQKGRCVIAYVCSPVVAVKNNVR